MLPTHPMASTRSLPNVARFAALWLTSSQSCPAKYVAQAGGCSKAGEKHYWRDRCRIIQEAFAANPWRFPPVVVRAGEQINAWDGIQPGDSVLYPGLLRADIISS